MPRVALTHYEAHYQQLGRGPDVVLLHGFTSNLAMWMFSGLPARLSDRYRVTMYDLRGHGASTAPAAGYTSAHLADDLADLHAALGLEPAVLVGHSFGGVVAMHAAARFPEPFAAVVLSDSYFPGLSTLEPNMEYAEVWVQLREKLLAVGHDIGPRVDFRRLLGAVATVDSAGRARLTEQLGAPAARWLSQLGPLARTSAAEEMNDPAGLTASMLAGIRQPVVALYDERSPFEATYRWLLSQLPNCRGARVPGASHLALLENPAAFCDLVDRHLTALASEKHRYTSDAASFPAV